MKVEVPSREYAITKLIFIIIFVFLFFNNIIVTAVETEAIVIVLKDVYKIIFAFFVIFYSFPIIFISSSVKFSLWILCIFLYLIKFQVIFLFVT